MMKRGMLGIALTILCCHLWSQENGKKILHVPPHQVGLPFFPHDGVSFGPHINQTLFFEFETYNLIVSYPAADASKADATGKRRQFRVVQATHVQPHVAVSIFKKVDGVFLYEYSVSNRAKTEQDIRSWYLEVPTIIPPDPDLPQPEVPIQPSGWKNDYFAPEPGRWTMRWQVESNTAGIRSGEVTSTFQLIDRKLPGIAKARFQGPKAKLNLPEDLPQETALQLVVSQTLNVNSIVAVTIGPKFMTEEWKRNIANDFQYEINEMVLNGIGDPHSPFLTEVLTVLQQYIDINVSAYSSKDSGDPSGIHIQTKLSKIKTKPTGELESEILEALRYSIGVED